MAKQMTDEQKLFFGTKAQRKAMIKKHPSWAKDKSGFRQTIKGKRNPFKKAVKKAAKFTKKVAKKIRRITLATINAKIRRGLKLNAADSAWVRKHHPTDAYLAYTIPLHPGAPSYTKPENGGGGSTSWLTGDQLFKQKDEQLRAADKVIDQVLGKALPGAPVDLFKNVLGNFKLFEGGTIPGVAAIVPGIAALAGVPSVPGVTIQDFQAIDRAITSQPGWVAPYDPQSQFEGSLGF